MEKKEIAKNFLNMAAFGHVREAYEKYVSKDFIHHNQYFKGDRNSLLLAMEEAHKNSPNKSIEIKNVFEDGDYAITHSLVKRVKKEESDVAVVHIFKIKKDNIVELWDLGMLILKDSPNENGLF